MDMPEKIMLIDGNSIVNRAFYGLPLLTNGEGVTTNGVYGFLNILLKLMEEETPQYLAVAFDLHAPTFRHEKFAAYKGTRKSMPEELVKQMPLLKEVLDAMGIKYYEQAGFEADDLLGTLSKKAKEAGIIPVIVSGDRDLLQLADPVTKIRIPKTKAGGTEVEDYYAQDVERVYGVTPKQFIELKALMGDASDNIPGVPGIGQKTATKIIQAYGSLEEAITHAKEIQPKKAGENLAQYVDQARMSLWLATIQCEAPIDLNLDEVRVGNLFTAEAYEYFKRLNFKTLLPRFNQPTTQGKEKEVKVLPKVLDSTEKISEWIQSLPKNTLISVVLFQEDSRLVAVSACEERGCVWIELDDGNNLALSIKPLLSGDYRIIGHDVKKDIRLMAIYDIVPAPVFFDTALAGYVLNPLKDTYEYDDLAADFLNCVCPSQEEVLGKGKSRQSILSLTKEARAVYGGRQAKIYYDSFVVMEQKLKENNQMELYQSIELPLMYVLSDMEKYGIGVDKEALQDYGQRLSVRIDTLTKEIYEMAGEEFNINSPKQLGVILFEKLGLPGGKKTKTGYSTAADVLEKLRTEVPIIDRILLYRQYMKLKSTYADGLMQVLDEATGRIYSTFNQTVTATGRISSTEPNLQNIPVRLSLGRELRKVFLPADGFVFLDADYSQIELRVLAHMAEDESLINAFITHQDIHRMTASQVFHIPFDQVTAQQRSNAKAVNFGIIYGISAFSLSQDIGVTRKEADTYIKNYFKQYPKIKGYMDKTIADAKENGYVSTLFHRRRPMPELKSTNFVQRSFGERVAMNMPIQGTAADIIKIAMVKVHKALKENQLRSRLILQVHDELLIEAAQEEVEIVSRLLKENMEQAVQLKVQLEAEVHMGHSWYEAK